MKTASLQKTIRKTLLTSQLLSIALPLAVAYALITLYLFNYQLVGETWLGSFPLSYKFSLMISLLPGFFTLFSGFDLFLLILTSLLVGINCMVALTTMQRIKQRGKVTLSIGGASVIGIAAAGCTTCGISLFALFGLSSAISFLPFHGLELHITAVILLFVSLVYMLKKLHEEVYCKIKDKSD